MKAIKLLTLLTALLALALYAQTVTYFPDTHQFSLDGSTYLSRISRDAVIAGPSWDTSKPVPVSFARAETVARAELRKMVSDEPSWRVRSFAIVNLPRTSCWYYVVELSPTTRREKETTGFTVLIDLHGKPGHIEEGRLDSDDHR